MLYKRTDLLGWSKRGMKPVFASRPLSVHVHFDSRRSIDNSLWTTLACARRGFKNDKTASVVSFPRRLKPLVPAPQDPPAGFLARCKRAESLGKQVGALSANSLLFTAHAKVNVEDVRLDLVACSVLWELRHLQHLKNGSGIPIAPLDKGGQDRVQIGGP